jgi:hypothetical protein
MRRHGHGAEQVGLFSVRTITQLCCRLGLVERQRQLVNREALSPRTKMLVPGQPDLLKELIDKERLLLELPLLLENQGMKLVGSSVVSPFVSLSLSR